MGDKKRFATKEASDTNRRKKDVTSKFKGKVFILQQSSVLVHLIRHFFFLQTQNASCFQFKFNTQCRFLLRLIFFPIHIRLRFATITLLIGCNRKNLGAIKKAFLCLYFSNRKVLSAGNKNVDAR